LRAHNVLGEFPQSVCSGTRRGQEEGPYFTAMIEGFRALGYIEGCNIKFEHRFPNEMPERFKAWRPNLYR
jgi:hypothetical protein